MLIAYIPYGSEDDARKAAEALLDAHLIACANIHPSASLYRWKGEVKEEEGWVLVGKTMPERKEALAAFVKERHPYDLPAIVTWEADATPDYLSWVREETGV